MNSSAAEIDLQLRDDFRRYLREYGVDSTFIDPILAVLFRTFAHQIYSVSSDTDRLRMALLDELLDGLGVERRFAHPAQAVVRYKTAAPVEIPAGTELTGEPERGGRMTFLTDYPIAISSARIGAVFVYQQEAQQGEAASGRLRLLSGMELPEETLRAEPAYDAVPAALGILPAIYIGVENLSAGLLSRHGLFLQTSPEATLLNAQLEREHWYMASPSGRFQAENVLRPGPLNGGQSQLQWLQEKPILARLAPETELPSLPGGFWRGKCFALPSMGDDRDPLCEVPLGLEAPLRAIFGRPTLFLRPRIWLRIPLDPRVEPLHTAISAVHLHAQSVSNVQLVNQTIRFAEHGTTIPLTPQDGIRSFLVAPLSVTGESGDTYQPEFQPAFAPGRGRYRLQRGHLTLLPGKMPNGQDETSASVRLWMSEGAGGNGMGAARLRHFARKLPGPEVLVENITTAAGGADGEPLDATRKRFAEVLLARQRLITRADFEIALRSFDARVTRVQIDPTLTRGLCGGLRRLHRITVTAPREWFAEPEAEGRVLVADLETYLAQRIPLDADVVVELAWA